MDAGDIARAALAVVIGLLAVGALAVWSGGEGRYEPVDSDEDALYRATP